MRDLTASNLWHLVGVSVPGTAHQKQDIHSQDAFTTHQDNAGNLVIAVADGAGSASRANQGAHLAIGEARQVLVEALESQTSPIEENWIEVTQQAFYQAYRAIQETAEASDLPTTEFATTLTLGVITPTFLCAGQLGDGMLIASSPGGDYFPVTTPQRGEYANETQFLTSEGALDAVEVHYLSGEYTQVAAFTDGLLRLAVNLDGYQPHAPFFHPLFAFTAGDDDYLDKAPKLVMFLCSDRVNARTDDDKTLVLAVKKSPR